MERQIEDGRKKFNRIVQCMRSLFVVCTAYIGSLSFSKTLEIVETIKKIPNDHIRLRYVSTFDLIV